MAINRPDAVAIRASAMPPVTWAAHVEGVEHADDGAEQTQQRRQRDDGIEYPQRTVEHRHFMHDRFFEVAVEGVAVDVGRLVVQYLEQAGVRQLRQFALEFEAVAAAISLEHGDQRGAAFFHEGQVARALDDDGQGYQEQRQHHVKRAAGIVRQVEKMRDIHDVPKNQMGEPKLSRGFDKKLTLKSALKNPQSQSG